MQRIKVKFTDFWDGFVPKENYLYLLLTKYYDVELSDKPDYLFYSCFGNEYLKYDCIRIFTVGENIRPDFNLCDYAMAMDYMEFGDRYIRFPFMKLMYHQESSFELLENRKLSEDDYKKKIKFCNFIYGNADTETPREEIFNAINKLKPIDSAGRYMNNVGHPVDNKVEFQKSYVFSIAVENSVMRGYNTEKILDAFLAGTIPIYMGDPEINKIYNKDAFINANDFETLDELAEYVVDLYSKPEKIKEMLSQPPLTPDYRKYLYSVDRLKAFLDNIFSQDLKSAKRRGTFFWENKHEKLVALGYQAMKKRNDKIGILRRIKRALFK